MKWKFGRLAKVRELRLMKANGDCIFVIFISPIFSLISLAKISEFLRFWITR